mmetsp:Transcript_133351/g.231374  ORF Transcript_133351/g.231374 Transcript_133351/m.231374 type:complete len:318 (-) Transcript_133351:1042-1995(-)
MWVLWGLLLLAFHDTAHSSLDTKCFADCSCDTSVSNRKEDLRLTVAFIGDSQMGNLWLTVANMVHQVVEPMRHIPTNFSSTFKFVGRQNDGTLKFWGKIKDHGSGPLVLRSLTPREHYKVSDYRITYHNSPAILLQYCSYTTSALRAKLKLALDTIRQGTGDYLVAFNVGLWALAGSKHAKSMEVRYRKRFDVPTFALEPFIQDVRAILDMVETAVEALDSRHRVRFMWLELAYLAPYKHGFDETFSDPYVRQINDALFQGWRYKHISLLRVHNFTEQSCCKYYDFRHPSMHCNAMLWHLVMQLWKSGREGGVITVP